MRIPARSSISLALLALGLGCASKSSMAPAYDGGYPGHDPGYDMAMEASPEMMAPEMQSDGPVAQGASPSVSPGPGAVMPAAVMGALPPSQPVGAEVGTAVASDGGGQRAVADDMPTTGDDSVDQMLIFNGSLHVAVQPDSIPASIDAAVDQAVKAGGYISQQTDTSLVLRVPSRRFRRLMRGLEGLGEVKSRSVQTVDVSEQFHDLKVRLENLQATRSRIQKLMSQAKDLSEILVVEKELERISAEIDAIEGQLRYLGSQAAFSTVTMNFSELPRELVVVEDDRKDEEILPPPPPPPARVLGTSVGWIDEVDVNHLLSLR
ncbi:DUF4349 domain-containing protein [Paraliomyxa miuraensis]|uniref:DUF4349 domain-containing protein n=1 Tax=Paraliomyxa miuraensis TaxID=376150 RepID=UPI002258C5BA|nr:DUF4349 domain-containing protein [Paraliomyxa miuraensis]MCX4247337.1 DUF4349 domain-containing protein [Paraliomyxa miuraensis]